MGFVNVSFSRSGEFHYLFGTAYICTSLTFKTYLFLLHVLVSHMQNNLHNDLYQVSMLAVAASCLSQCKLFAVRSPPNMQVFSELYSNYRIVFFQKTFYQIYCCWCHVITRSWEIPKSWLYLNLSALDKPTKFLCVMCCPLMTNKKVLHVGLHTYNQLTTCNHRFMRQVW